MEALNMSLELYIAIPAICDPSAKDLNAAAAAFELPIILENSFNLKSAGPPFQKARKLMGLRYSQPEELAMDSGRQR